MHFYIRIFTIKKHRHHRPVKPPDTATYLCATYLCATYLCATTWLLGHGRTVHLIGRKTRQKVTSFLWGDYIFYRSKWRNNKRRNKPLSIVFFKSVISSANPGIRYKPSISSPRFSISMMHLSTTSGRRWSCTLISVVKSTLNIRLTSFLSGLQSRGTRPLHCLWQSYAQSEIENEKQLFHGKMWKNVERFWGLKPP